MAFMPSYPPPMHVSPLLCSLKVGGPELEGFFKRCSFGEDTEQSTFMSYMGPRVVKPRARAESSPALTTSDLQQHISPLNITELTSELLSLAEGLERDDARSWDSACLEGFSAPEQLLARDHRPHSVDTCAGGTRASSSYFGSSISDGEGWMLSSLWSLGAGRPSGCMGSTVPERALHGPCCPAAPTEAPPPFMNSTVHNRDALDGVSPWSMLSCDELSGKQSGKGVSLQQILQRKMAEAITRNSSNPPMSPTRLPDGSTIDNDTRRESQQAADGVAASKDLPSSASVSSPEQRPGGNHGCEADLNPSQGKNSSSSNHLVQGGMSHIWEALRGPPPVHPPCLDGPSLRVVRGSPLSQPQGLLAQEEGHILWMSEIRPYSYDI